jgi:hypothetical protein
LNFCLVIVFPTIFIESKNINFISGIEISDVLKIDDKDYSITFSLYFNVQWSEPRLNLSSEFFETETENTTGEEQLVPGKQQFRNNSNCKLAD